MPTALWIAHVEVTNPESYAEYAKGATVAIAAHGGAASQPDDLRPAILTVIAVSGGLLIAGRLLLRRAP